MTVTNIAAAPGSWPLSYKLSTAAVKSTPYTTTVMKSTLFSSFVIFCLYIDINASFTSLSLVFLLSGYH